MGSEPIFAVDRLDVVLTVHPSVPNQSVTWPVAGAGVYLTIGAAGPVISDRLLIFILPS